MKQSPSVATSRNTHYSTSCHLLSVNSGLLISLPIGIVGTPRGGASVYPFSFRLHNDDPIFIGRAQRPPLDNHTLSCGHPNSSDPSLNETERVENKGIPFLSRLL